MTIRPDGLKNKAMYDIDILSDSTTGGIRTISVRPSGIVCAGQIDISVEGDIVKSVRFTNGCSGNTQGVAALCTGMKVADAVERLSGIDCRRKGTSCPDQLARALKLFL